MQSKLLLKSVWMVEASKHASTYVSSNISVDDTCFIYFAFERSMHWNVSELFMLLLYAIN